MKGNSPEDIQTLYRAVRRIRRVEERIADIYPSDKIKSPVHLSIGQEAAAVGVIDLLHPTDAVAASYRCHAAYLAKGGDLKAMMAELYGKPAGCAGGRGGSMHLVAMEEGFLGASAVVATQIPHACGFALAFRRSRPGAVAVAFFGDGATEEGVFYESLNFAALRKLPVLFVCENNGLAIHTPLAKRWATERLCERVSSFGMPAVRVADGEVLSIRAAAAPLIAAMRDGGGPAFLECVTYRWREHVGPGEDYDAGYRDRRTLEEWQEKDPVARLGAAIPDALRASIDREIEREIEDAVAFAEASPPPAAGELLAHVFAP